MLFTRYYSCDQMKKNEIDGSCRKAAYWVLMGEIEGKRPLGRPRRRWEYNVKIDLEVGAGAWTGLIWLRIGTGGGLLWL